MSKKRSRKPLPVIAKIGQAKAEVTQLLATMSVQLKESHGSLPNYPGCDTTAKQLAAVQRNLAAVHALVETKLRTR